VINPVPPPPAPPTPDGPLWPANWGVRKQLTIMQVQTQNLVGSGNLNGQGAQTTNYYFDAVFNVEHEQRAVATKHPVQTGAAISDHMYLEPSVVSIPSLISSSNPLKRHSPSEFKIPSFGLDVGSVYWVNAQHAVVFARAGTSRKVAREIRNT
jgi:hypothetical protein